jgi:hypothetical protein
MSHMSWWWTYTKRARELWKVPTGGLCGLLWKIYLQLGAQGSKFRPLCWWAVWPQKTWCGWGISNFGLSFFTCKMGIAIWIWLRHCSQTENEQKRVQNHPSLAEMERVASPTPPGGILGKAWIISLGDHKAPTWTWRPTELSAGGPMSWVTCLLHALPFSDHEGRLLVPACCDLKPSHAMGWGWGPRMSHGFIVGASRKEPRTQLWGIEPYGTCGTQIFPEKLLLVSGDAW